MKSLSPRSPLLALLLFLCLAPRANADWTAIRDLIRQADDLQDNDRQEEIYRKAYAMAQASVAANPNVSNEELWLANAAGRLALVAPVKERIKLSRVVKDHAERAITLDSRNGPAYMTLGAWHFYVADLSWIQKKAASVFYGGLPPASYSQAVDLLTKALAYGVPNPVEVYYIRGRAHEELDQDAAARTDFQACIAGTARNQKERGMQKEAREKLE